MAREVSEVQTSLSLVYPHHPPYTRKEENYDAGRGWRTDTGRFGDDVGVAATAVAAVEEAVVVSSVGTLGVYVPQSCVRRRLSRARGVVLANDARTVFATASSGPSRQPGRWEEKTRSRNPAELAREDHVDSTRSSARPRLRHSNDHRNRARRCLRVHSAHRRVHRVHCVHRRRLRRRHVVSLAAAAVTQGSPLKTCLLGATTRDELESRSNRAAAGGRTRRSQTHIYTCARGSCRIIARVRSRANNVPRRCAK